MAENEKIEVLVSTMSFISTEYILRKQLGGSKTRQTLTGIRAICKVCTSGEKEIALTMVSEIKDFEDSFQYFTALNNSANVIITRNHKDFKGSRIPILSAEEYIKFQ